MVSEVGLYFLFPSCLHAYRPPLAHFKGWHEMRALIPQKNTLPLPQLSTPILAPASPRLRPPGGRAVLTHRQGHHAIRDPGGPAASLPGQAWAAGDLRRQGHQEELRRRHSDDAGMPTWRPWLAR